MEKDEKEKEKKENADLAMPRKRSSLKNTIAESGAAAEAEEVFTFARRPAFLVDDLDLVDGLQVVAALVEAASEDFFFLATGSLTIVRPTMPGVGWLGIRGRLWICIFLLFMKTPVSYFCLYYLIFIFYLLGFVSKKPFLSVILKLSLLRLSKRSS